MKPSKTPRMNKGLYSSRTEEWETPQYVFNALNAEFHFVLDPASTHENAKCEKHYTVVEDGLLQKWHGTVFLNPPYGKTIYHWMSKAYTEAQRGCTVVCLVHARTDTRWWHDYAMQASEIRFVRGRLKFGDGKQSAPFPSCVVIFRSALDDHTFYNTARISTISFDARTK